MRRLRALVLTLAACGGPTPDPAAPPPLGTPLPGVEALRSSRAFAPAGGRFDGATPWVLEFSVPSGVVVPGRGLPVLQPDTATPEALVDPTAEDRSVVQLELPVKTDVRVDEDTPGTASSFALPRFCVVGAPCALDPDTEGLWRAVRVRTLASGAVRVEELQLVEGAEQPFFGPRTPAGRLVTLWLDAGAPPLDDRDRVRFSYVGRVPLRATDWLGDDGALRPRLRYRPAASGPVDCPASDPACWVVLDDADVQPLEVRAGPVAFVEVRGPLDVTAGAPFEVEVVALDRFGNPTAVNAPVDVWIGGRRRARVALRQAWRGVATVTAPVPGPFALGATHPFDATTVHHWVRVWGAAGPPFVRRLGDLHTHTGGDGSHRFLDTNRWGDHRGNFARADATFAFLDTVAGLDFGAVSEHASDPTGFVTPPGTTAFDPGQPCAPAPATLGVGAWWAESQALAHAYEAAHPDFATFPAYEWQGQWRDGAAVDVRLHRVVVFRDHDPATPWGHPMLPGNGLRRAPQCLFHFLEQHGRTPRDVLTLPHLMVAVPGNADWALTYAPRPGYDTLVSADAPDRWQRVGEIYSARNVADGRDQGRAALSAFEGLGDDPTGDLWSFRHGWRDVGATVGVIGGGDGHQGLAGMNDHVPDDPATLRPLSHEPGGFAVVLADPTAPLRDGVFDAVHDRRTYGTTGIRAWLDFAVWDAGAWQPMGRELASSRCRMPARVELMAGRAIRDVAVWGAPVGQPVGFVPVVRRAAPNTERFQADFDLVNPVATGGAARWVYYVRAYLGAPVDLSALPEEVEAGHEDAVWGSPIWVDWSACR